MTQHLRVGFVGCGSIARSHLQNLATSAYGRPWAFADGRPDAAEACQAEFGGAYATDDVERVIADRDVDVVLVATPDKMHAEHALAVLAAGKHLFLEKPMATSVADALRVQRAAVADIVKALGGGWQGFAEGESRKA